MVLRLHSLAKNARLCSILWSLTLVLPRICFLTVLCPSTLAKKHKAKNVNGTFLQVEGVGKIFPLLLEKDGIERCVTFSECLFLPDHSHYVISVGKLKQNAAQVNFGQSLSILVNRNATCWNFV